MRLLTSAGCLANCQCEGTGLSVEKAALKSKMKKEGDDMAQIHQFSQY